MFRRGVPQDIDVDNDDSLSMGSTHAHTLHTHAYAETIEPSQPVTIQEELAAVQRQVNELTSAVQNKDQEIEDLRDANKKEHGAFSKLKLQLDKIENSMRDVVKDSAPKKGGGSNPSRVTLARGNTKRFMRSRRRIFADGRNENYEEEKREMEADSEDFLPQRSPLVASVKEPGSDDKQEDSSLVRSTKENTNMGKKTMRKSLFASIVDWKNDLFEGEDEEEVDEPNFIAFDEDTFSLMMISPVCSRYWFLGMLAAAFQWTVLILILVDLAVKNDGSVLGIPYSVPYEVTVGQYLGIFICVGVQTDVLSSIRMLIAMRNTEETIWDEIVYVAEDKRTWGTWLARVLFPNLVKFLSGLLVLTVNFITIVQSGNIVDLMKDVAALLIISEITEIFFKLAEFGFLGNRFEDRAKLVLETEVEDSLLQGIKPICGITIPARLMVFITLVGIMMGAVGFFISGQISGMYFNDTFPYCTIGVENIPKIGDGKCEGGIYNTIACDFDGGDCVSFNLQYPNCNKAPEPFKVGDGECDEIYNNPECGFDGNDCCPFKTENSTDPRFDDGTCDGGKFFAELCSLDGFDCQDYARRAPKCDYEQLSDLVPFGKEPRLGDGICESKIYNTPECLFENGDCEKCNNQVVDYTLIGDGVCHGGPYNTEDCNSDAGDCESYNNRWPRCKESTKNVTFDNMEKFPIIGDGICNSGLYNNEDCGYEDGDCLFCNELIDDPTKIGDGVCDGQQYMSEVCGYDGGDCAGCNAPRFEVGNGWCTNEYNTPECGFDGGDCLTFKSNYTGCKVEFPSLLGNGHCNGDEYNTLACQWDGGDCNATVLEEVKREDCDNPKHRHYLLGNGVCNQFLNNAECDYDDGDCEHFNKEYPDCVANFNDVVPSFVGDGVCHGGNYNIKECGFDGGDCLVEVL